MEKALALNVLSNISGSDWDIKGTEIAAKTLATCAKEDGLSHSDLNTVACALSEDKLNSFIQTSLLRSLVPESNVPNEVVSKVLAWTFSNLGKKSPSVERLSFRWVAALLQYKLCEKDVPQMYYYDFFYAVLGPKHLEIPGVMVLYYLSGKDDAKKLIIQPLLKRHKLGSFPQLNSLLRPDLIKESFPEKTLSSPNSCFDDAMQKAAERVEQQEMNKSYKELDWNTYKSSTGLKKKPRLIPAINYLDRDGDVGRPKKTIYEYKSMVDLGKNQLEVSTPAQVMALLSSEGGFHHLAFAKPSAQAKFIINLEQTLNYAFLRPSGPYSFTEKTFLLSSIAALEEFLQQSISVVNKVLVNYLLTWDGADYYKQIHELLEWLTLESVEEWDVLKSVLRVYFRFAEMEEKFKMLMSLTSMVRNMVSTSMQARLNLPRLIDNDSPKVDTALALTLIENLVSELITESLTWSRMDHNRTLLAGTLSFYHSAVNAEDAGDLPTMTMIPMAAVYQCLFSNSGLLIERLCSLLIKYESTRERLFRLGVFEEFESNFVDLLAVYLMDAYRILFGGTNFMPELYPGIFTPQYFEKSSKLNIPNEIQLSSIFSISGGFSWAASNLEENQCVDTLAQHYPSIFAVKKYVEDKLRL